MTTSRLVSYLAVAVVTVAAAAIAVWVATVGIGHLDAADLASVLIGTHVAVALMWWVAGRTLR